MHQLLHVTCTRTTNWINVQYYENFDYLVFFMSKKIGFPDEYRVSCLTNIVWAYVSSDGFIKNNSIISDIFDKQKEKKFKVSNITIIEIENSSKIYKYTCITDK